ncbi:MAG: cobyric acid synthase [Thermoanaerobacteraceae bacterium]|nr:cobyric acid synthase [Thermoanaerobacteraceae bacterium]
MTAKCIMVQGTGSSVGKSRLVTGLCRVFRQDGFKVAPFKSQNMALNSYITNDGLEMGRAQATQAEACGIQPSVLMNPVLLKPHTDKNSQVIVKGKPFGSLSAMDYHEYKIKLMNVVKECYYELARDNDIIIIEGAGSPAEINLRERDIVNMGMAQLVDAPVVLVGDIDRGGVFAALAGTLLLLTDEEKARVKAVIINKFRGDLELLEPGLKMLEDIINRPVLGVVPYTDIYIDEEDSPETERHRLLQKYKVHNSDIPQQKPLQAKILSLPRITNFTDFVPIGEFDGIKLSYVSGGPIEDADIVIIPGSENPKESMDFIKSRGWDKEINLLSKNGTVILGIGSSFSLLGKTFTSSLASENTPIKGLGLLDAHIKLLKKEPMRVSGEVTSGLTDPESILSDAHVEGYRIYSGEIIMEDEAENKFIKIIDGNNDDFDGLISRKGRVIGTFIHGIFDNTNFTQQFINYLKSTRFNNNIIDNTQSFDFKKYREAEYDRWAHVVRQNLDIDTLYKIMGIKA